MTSDWSPTNNGAYWDMRARPARVTRSALSPPTQPSLPAGDAGPTADTQGGYQGCLIGIQKNFPGAAASSSAYAVIPSLRVLPGCEVRAYAFTGFRKSARAFTFDWSGSGPAIRSYDVRAPSFTPQPR